MSASQASSQRASVFCQRYGSQLDPDYPHLPYCTDAKRSLIDKAILSSQRTQRVSFLPVIIDNQLRPEVLCRDDARFDDAVQYIDWASKGFPHQFTVSGDEVVVSPL